jgi:5-methylcytosine-specific restriction endonuclease McrA
MKVTKEQVVEASKLPSAIQSAASLGIRYVTYQKYAKQYGVWKTNQQGKGIKKPKPEAIKTEDILAGLYPHYQRLGIKRRLLKEGYKTYNCEMCGLVEWNGTKISLELDHINGDCYDHKLTNLRFLCPNCHSTTSNYRGKNKLSCRSTS